VSAAAQKEKPVRYGGVMPGTADACRAAGKGKPGAPAAGRAAAIARPVFFGFLLAVLVLAAGCTAGGPESSGTGAGTGAAGIAGRETADGPAGFSDGTGAGSGGAESADIPPPPPEPAFAEARLIAVGDIMMHLPQTRSGYDPESGTYSFHHFFEMVKPFLSAGDWVIGNLETPLADGDRRGYTGYPEFNAPPELADALKEAGFNILTTANNHALDRRESGVLRTLENLRDRGLVAVGTHASPEEAERVTVVEKNGVSLAILAYTYGTNGIPIPEGKDYLVNLINEEKIANDIKKARSAGADAVAVALHFGTEYQTMPSDEQKRLARSLLAKGADLILGSHPHVLQPYEIVEAAREDGTVKEGIILYSMGNFISNQDRLNNNGKPTDIGAIFEIGIKKQMPGGPVSFTGVRAIPTYVHKYSKDGVTRHRVLPLEAVLLERDDALLTEKDYVRLEQYWAETNAHLAAFLPAPSASAAP
jgi:poly-gamma-glutamate synthesis protein (capsule biosynthesis protein)